MLTVDDLREHVETDLGDDALGLLLDAAYEAIDIYAGTAGDSTDATGQVVELLSGGPGELLMLSRPASAITSVIEADTTLDTDDFQLIGDQMVRRLDAGANPARRWGSRVLITYTRLSDSALRDTVAIGLVRLEIDTEPGKESESLGDHSVTFAQGDENMEARNALLASLAGGFVAK